MKDSHIFKDITGDIEQQLTGGCYSVPAVALTLLILAITLFRSFL